MNAEKNWRNTSDRKKISFFPEGGSAPSSMISNASPHKGRRTKANNPDWPKRGKIDQRLMRFCDHQGKLVKGQLKMAQRKIKNFRSPKTAKKVHQGEVKVALKSWAENQDIKCKNGWVFPLHKCQKSRELRWHNMNSRASKVSPAFAKPQCRCTFSFAAKRKVKIFPFFLNSESSANPILF